MQVLSVTSCTDRRVGSLVGAKGDRRTYARHCIPQKKMKLRWRYVPMGMKGLELRLG